jgi:hypothetical protein
MSQPRQAVRPAAYAMEQAQPQDLPMPEGEQSVQEHTVMGPEIAADIPPELIDETGEYYGGEPVFEGEFGEPCAGCGDPCGCGAACGGACGGPGCSGCQPSGYGNFCHGWIAQGITFNTHSPDDRFNGPLTFNDRSNEYQLNQLYLAFEECVNRCGSAWDIGGRVDLLYGTDYFFTTARGLETRPDGSPRWNSADGPRAGGASLYGLAMPQLYAEVYAPVGNGLSVKLGHFYTIVGYESVMYPANFFYSRSYTKQYGEPFTHTGLLADYRLSDEWTLYSGFTRGWDTWEDENSQLAYLGGLGWCRPDGSESLRFSLHTGNEDDARENNRTVYSLVYSTLLTPRFAYAVEHNFGVEDNAASQGNTQVPAHWYGISQYFVCEVNCQTQLGVRAEWFRDEENARVLSIPVEDSVGGNYVAVTLGANYRPAFSDSLEIRPELRWDWSDTQNLPLGVRGLYGDFQEHYQLTAAISAAVCF